jgi:hypothetical protein
MPVTVEIKKGGKVAGFVQWEMTNEHELIGHVTAVHHSDPDVKEELVSRLMDNDRPDFVVMTGGTRPEVPGSWWDCVLAVLGVMEEQTKAFTYTIPPEAREWVVKDLPGGGIY